VEREVREKSDMKSRPLTTAVFALLLVTGGAVTAAYGSGEIGKPTTTAALSPPK
jgi:hypothetical protein